MLKFYYWYNKGRERESERGQTEPRDYADFKRCWPFSKKNREGILGVCCSGGKGKSIEEGAMYTFLSPFTCGINLFLI